MADRKWTDTLNLAVNIGVPGVLLFVLLGPGGYARDWIERHRAESERRAAIAEGWTELVDEGARLDDGDYDVGLVEFADYQCPACRAIHRRLAALAEELQVGIVLRHMPLTPIHPAAEGAARAAICAEAFGRFRSMRSDWLFGTTAWQDARDWTTEALAAGIADTATFRSCLHSDTTSARLARDQALAQRLGVRGTPTFVGRGGVYTGTPTKEDLLAIVTRTRPRFPVLLQSAMLVTDPAQ